MATVDDIVSRVRLELADQATGFIQMLTGDGATTIFNLDYYPLDAESLAATVNGVEIDPAAVYVEERTGKVMFETAPGNGVVVKVTGTHYRYFPNTDLQQFVGDAAAQHTAGRTDDYGRPLTLDRLPVVESYPLGLLATVQALYALATDAAFDIDIHAPDGVTIPRSERYRQLMDMLAVRKDQYDQLCAALNIGLNAIQVFTFRRISKATGRYVPVYQPQEIDDVAPPTRLYLPLPSYGATIQPPTSTVVADITVVAGTSYEATVNLGMDLTNYTVSAVILAYAGALKSVLNFTVTVIDAPAGVVELTLTPTQTANSLPHRGVWALKITDVLDSTSVSTLVSGAVIVEEQVAP